MSGGYDRQRSRGNELPAGKGSNKFEVVRGGGEAEQTNWDRDGDGVTRSDGVQLGWIMGGDAIANANANANANSNSNSNGRVSVSSVERSRCRSVH